MKKHDVAKKMKPERFNEATRKYIQNYGEQHPDFMAAHRETKKLQKGKGSLNMPKGEKNEGERNYLGKNENNKQ